MAPTTESTRAVYIPHRLLNIVARGSMTEDDASGSQEMCAVTTAVGLSPR